MLNANKVDLHKRWCFSCTLILFTMCKKEALYNVLNNNCQFLEEKAISGI